MALLLIYTEHFSQDSLTAFIESHEHQKINYGLYFVEINEQPRDFTDSLNKYISRGDSILVIPIHQSDFGYLFGTPRMEEILKWVHQKLYK